jgi:hypothetical protein
MSFGIQSLNLPYLSALLACEAAYVEFVFTHCEELCTEDIPAFLAFVQENLRKQAFYY